MGEDFDSPPHPQRGVPAASAPVHSLRPGATALSTSPAPEHRHLPAHSTPRAIGQETLAPNMSAPSEQDPQAQACDEVQEAPPRPTPKTAPPHIPSRRVTSPIINSIRPPEITPPRVSGQYVADIPESIARLEWRMTNVELGISNVLAYVTQILNSRQNT
ncbi:hypothetical protein OBBRIDRAFT_828872 [Obba rivulosa]|uniref:Uncharacterized protein n=1 Tax=Obba rivulosa TaxID=1052685 RepID=A0A8E2DG40_9APHY|nr:hypothetical protein OBBRIDRAFT_828872 [Obba rivulosa]